MLASHFCGEFLLHIPCWLHFYLGSFSYTSRAVFILIQGVFLPHPVLRYRCLCKEFLLHIPCWLRGFCCCFFIWGVSFTYPFLFFVFVFLIGGVFLTHPVLASFLSRELLLHIPCWIYFYLGSFSYTSGATFTFIWGVSLTHPMLASVGTYPSYPSRAGFIFMRGVSLTHPMLDSFLFREFVLHIPCYLHFYLGSFSYKSRGGFIFI